MIRFDNVFIMFHEEHLNDDVPMSKFMLKLVRHLVHTIVNMYSCMYFSLGKNLV